MPRIRRQFWRIIDTLDWKGVSIFMAKQDFNPHIRCNVAQCRFNCKSEDCCSLTEIDVQQEAKQVASEHSTCCHSFECK